jgi:hypothetical protein
MIAIQALTLAVSVLISLLAGCLIPGGEFRSLRNDAARPLFPECQQQISLRLNGLLCASVRGVGRWVDLPPEARAALDAFRGGEVMITDLRSECDASTRAAFGQAADRVMTRRGWERTVRVEQAQELVLVYVKPGTPDSLQAAVVVIEGKQLVMASARVAPGRLIELASRHLEAENVLWPR